MKVILFANTDWYLYNFRLRLAESLRARGWEVLMLSPAGEFAARIQQAGLRWQEFPLSRRGMNPFSELGALLRLARLYRAEKPDLVNHFTIKCVLYGSLAARLAGIRAVVNHITGLGVAFTNRGLGAAGLRVFLRAFYRLALGRSQIIFQNPDDRAAFLSLRLASPAQTSLIRSSGVDLARFSPLPEPGGLPAVVLPARMLWAKGVGDFVQAAQILKNRGVAARFILAGDADPGNPSGVPEAQLKTWQAEGLVEWWGWQEDMPAAYAQVNLVCLPSLGEGVPRSLLEAAACARAIVATDVPGCREIVRHGENGLLIPPRNPAALADALERLLADPQTRQHMGAAGRTLVEKEFAVEQVIADTISVFDRLLPSNSA